MVLIFFPQYTYSEELVKGMGDAKFPTYCKECGERLEDHDAEYRHYIIGRYVKSPYGEAVYGKHCKRIAYKVETRQVITGKGYLCPRCDKSFETYSEMRKHLYKDH